MWICKLPRVDNCLILKLLIHHNHFWLIQVQRTFEPVFPLTLPLPKRSSLTLEDCLELYTKEKISSDPWY